MTTALLIDINSIQNLEHLKKIIEPTPFQKEPTTHLKLGCVLLVPNEIYNKITRLEQGDNGRKKMINSPYFIDTVINKSFVAYCTKKNLCEFINCHGHLSHAIKAAKGSIKRDSLLWVNCPIQDKNLDKYIDEMIELGFESPYICNSRPTICKTTNSKKDFTLCMFKRSDDEPKIIDKKHVYYIINEFLKYKSFCGLKLKFDKKTIKYLRKLPLAGKTKNKNGTITQKEIAGALFIDQVKNKISINNKTITIGKEEGVDVTNASFNFHSHPKEAYLNHKTDIGYPSSQDYFGYLESFINTGTIFHAVSTLEGVYIMSIQAQYVNNKKFLKSIKGNILKVYKVPFNTTPTPYTYLEIINNITPNIFNVSFFTWEELMNGAEVSVHFNKIGMNCFTDLDDKDIITTIHGSDIV